MRTICRTLGVSAIGLLLSLLSFPFAYADGYRCTGQCFYQDHTNGAIYLGPVISVSKAGRDPGAALTLGENHCQAELNLTFPLRAGLPVLLVKNLRVKSTQFGSSSRHMIRNRCTLWRYDSIHFVYRRSIVEEVSYEVISPESDCHYDPSIDESNEDSEFYVGSEPVQG